MTSLLAFLSVFLLVYAMSDTTSSEVPSGPEISATAPNSISDPEQSPPSTVVPKVALTPIDRPSSDSTTFQLVDDIACNASVSDKIYVLYDKNRALFDHCVIDAEYHIFPYLGVKPTATQVKNMAMSTSCVAVLTGVLLADIPQCTISGFALKAAAETLLKIHVDLIEKKKASPSAKRFRELMAWRQSVNLAKEAGVPYDSNSVLFRDFERNLDVARQNSSIRILPGYQIEYKLPSGSWYDADGEAYDDIQVKSDGTEDVALVGTVSPGHSDSQVSDTDAGKVQKESTAQKNSAPVVVVYGVVYTIVSLFLGAFIHMAL